MKPDREKRSAAEYSFEYFESVESRLRSRKSGVESWKVERSLDSKTWFREENKGQ